jgi:type IX secretion system substrate protein
MKKIYLLLFVMIAVTTAHAQTTLAAQDFESAPSDTWAPTLTPATYAVGGDVWATVASIGTITAPQSSATFWGMQDLENPNGGGAFDHTLAFPNIDVSGKTGLLLTFYYYTDGFDSTDTFRVEYFFDDVSQGEVALNKNTDAWTLVSKVVPDGTTNFRFTILVRQNGGSDYGGLDNVVLQSGANTAPSMSITSPTMGGTANVGSAGLTVSLDVQNFTTSADNGSGASDNSGDGFIKYTIDGGASVNKFDTGITTLTGLTNGSHTLVYELVDNSGASLSPAVSATVTFMYHSIIQTLPFYESFNYTAAQNLTAQTNWQNTTSGDEPLIASGSLSYTGLPTSMGNSFSFDGSGKDPFVEFSSVSRGTVYASFLFKVTDISAVTDLTDGGYFAVLGAFDARLWVRANPAATGTTYDIGFGAVSSVPPVTTSTYNVGDVVFAVMSYNIDNGTVNAWINPSSGDFGASAAPVATLTGTDTAFGGTSQVASISQFLFRQDSSGETPFITVDELRIGTTWASVTPTNTLAISQQQLLDGFAMYPNPVKDGLLNIKSASNAEKSISIYDMIGKRVYQKTTKANQINISNLKSGIYFVKVQQNAKTATRKLVVE